MSNLCKKVNILTKIPLNHQLLANILSIITILNIQLLTTQKRKTS